MPDYYDFDSNPISREEWALLLRARRHDLVRWQIGYDKVSETTISTVWLGLDHAWFPGCDPLIFETLIDRPDGDAEVVQRYSTAQQATAGHEHHLVKLRAAAEAV
jgi:hypothetical protein